MVTQAAPLNNLPVLMASIRQSALSGELVLDQNDGTRRLYYSEGSLIYLRSDVAGEQFGNYLLRQGILDFTALSELLANDEHYRLGEKVVQWGMMTVQERDCHLLSMQEQVMIHALEHAVLERTWNPGPSAMKLSEDLHFSLEPRHFIWNTFQEAHAQTPTCDLLFAMADWKWEGRTNLLDSVADLPLTPTKAYALAFLGTEAVTFETFLSLSRLGEQEAATLLITLWALGALTLTEGRLPPLAPATTPPIPEPPEPAEPAEPPPPPTVPSPELPPPPAKGFDSQRLEPLPPLEQPEFLDPEAPTVPAPLAEAEPVAVMDGPTKARKLLIKARQLLLQERTVEAIRCLEQSVQLEPEAGSAYEAWLLLGKLRMANPAWSTRSIDALQCASRLQPKAAEPWAGMGEVYYRKSFRANAMACFQRALELDPSVPIPPDVDLQEAAATNPSGPTGTSLFSRFKSMLGGSEK